MLHIRAGMTLRDIMQTPPRIIYGILDALMERGAYRKRPPRSILDDSLTPAQFRSMLPKKE